MQQRVKTTGFLVFLTKAQFKTELTDSDTAFTRTQ